MSQYGVDVTIAVYRFELAAPARSGCVDRELRELIGEREITFGEHGKPEAAGVHFNVSHSGHLAVIAIADRPVGVDLEHHRPLHDPAAFARRMRFDTIDPLELMRLWCRKEAWLKARGIGLAGITQSLDETGWFIADLEIAPGYSAAVACAGAAAPIRVISRKIST